MLDNTQNEMTVGAVVWRLYELSRQESLTQAEAAEMAVLTLVDAQLQQHPETWSTSETKLVRDDYLEAYAAVDAAERAGVPPSPRPWPFNHINWAAAAEDLRTQYVEIDFDGVTYWMRDVTVTPYKTE